MYKNLIQITGIIIMVVIIIYLAQRIYNIHSNSKEGFITSELPGMDKLLPIQNVAIESTNATIQSKITMLQDELMLKKNKKNYETTIINMDDYINLLMMQQIAKIRLDSGMKTFMQTLENLNTLKQSKEALNVAMHYLDKR